ncbi:hypothetical protein BOX15_Mlig027771g2 [Macrostomum lignano]|uniref:Uncharacterized protein n=2 Tax=Macrostomum lignano TaxID=282301 RepID=A0A267DEJ5_9PLAT|nr:hypothetical protein BOX15_Mlig027771g2 [Macrostomum lignano]
MHSWSVKMIRKDTKMQVSNDRIYMVGKLRYFLLVNCSKKAYWKLSIAAGRFVQANYKALLALLSSKSAGSRGRDDATVDGSAQLPFYITVNRTENKKTRMSVSATVDERNLLYLSSATVDDKLRMRLKNGRRDYRVCVQGSIGLVETESNLSIDTVSCTNATADARTCEANLASVMHTDSADLLTAAPTPSAPRRRLLSDNYDAETMGRLFRERYTTLRGEYFIFYSHGELICRKMLNAMGFNERQPEADTNEFRPVDKMALLWCNGTNSGAKRKSGRGCHIVNRLHFRGLIANKCSLARLLREFELNHPGLVPTGLQAATFYPDTVHLNGSGALSILDCMRRNPGGMFLMKPGHADCGEGIALLRSPSLEAGRSQSLNSLAAVLESKFSGYAHRDLIMQRYVHPPLLLEGRKFDLRVYLLLVPNLRSGIRRGVHAFCHPGYVRLACRSYRPDSDDPLLHLTNQAVQQRDPSYDAVKEDTVWTPDQLNDYINQRFKAPCTDWVRRQLYPRIRAILAHVVSLASSSLCDQPMSFELFGCDFLIGADFNVWLLELNSDPSLSTHTSTLSRIVTQTVEESICLAVEVLQRAARGQSTKGLVGQQDFCRIFSHTNESVARRVMARAGLRQPKPTGDC